MILIRFHGAFAPNSRLRARITAARRGPGAAEDPTAERDEAQSAPASLASSRRARPLGRVFGIDVESCSVCGGQLRTLARLGGRAGCRSRTPCGRPAILALRAADVRFPKLDGAGTGPGSDS